MKKNLSKTVVATIFVLAAILIFSDAYTSQNGIAGKTGSPGESTCQSGCHNSFALNSGGGSVVISCPTLVNWAYVPGTTYGIDVTVAKTGVSKFGFAMEALQANGANAGTLVVTNSTTMQLKSITVSGNSRTSITHKTNGGLATNSKTFSFNWTAPATNVGNVTFYAAGNASNSNNGSSGDYIYSTNQVVTVSSVGINSIEYAAADWNVYPNPVKENLMVDYTLNASENVKIELYDFNGRFQMPLYMSNLNAGRHQQLFNLDANLANGIYFVKLQAGDKVSMKKIVVSR